MANLRDKPYIMEDEDQIYINEIDEILPTSTPASIKMPSTIGIPSLVSRD